MSYQVVIADDRYQHYNEETKALSSLSVELIHERSSEPADLKKACKNADGLIVNLPIISADIIGNMAKCKVISRYGVGYDNVDVAAAAAKGILVCNVPDYCVEDVSDHALALLMSCVRKVPLRDKHIRNGIWDVQSAGKQFRTCGKTFVFFGYGRIARVLHRKLAGLNLAQVLVYDLFVKEEVINANGAKKVDMDTALREGDFFSIHMPLNDQTRYMFNETAFKKMKPTAILINTSRGAIINEHDLYKALSQGWITSAALDVFEKEPIASRNPLLALENIVLSCHIGWYTEESQTELKRKAAENVRDVLMGKVPKYLIKM